MDEVNNLITNFNHARYYHYYYYKNYLFLLVFAYLPVIFKIKKYMKYLPPFKNEFSNYLLGMWNIFLSLGSLLGTYYTLPYLINDIYSNGIENSICNGNYRYNNVSHAIALFNISKFY
jgi:hypothetical protein